MFMHSMHHVKSGKLQISLAGRPGVLMGEEGARGDVPMRLEVSDQVISSLVCCSSKRLAVRCLTGTTPTVCSFPRTDFSLYIIL